MLLLSRCIAAVFSANIVLSWPLCAWAFVYSLSGTTPTSGEFMMILPGTGIGAAISAAVLEVILSRNEDRMLQWEKKCLWIIAVSGAGLLIVTWTLLILVDLL